MKDREMLEMAAKAAGREFHWDGSVLVLDDYKGDECSAWNPLLDDGDAFRLAVDLGLQVYGREIGGTANDIFVDEADCGNDKYAATRLAIVKAAAEIGREM